jgi:hypothetical protein
MVCDKMILAFVMMACLYAQIETRPGKPDREPSQATLATLAGEYFHGDGFVNETLDVSVTGRLKYKWSACDGDCR